MTSAHSDLIETNLHRAFHYEQDADPGAVGAGKYWLDTNSGPPLELWRRNGTDTGWDQVGGGGGGVAFSGAKVWQFSGSPQSIPDNTNTEIIWDTVIWDTDSYWAGGNPTRLTVPVTGYYEVGAIASWGDGGGVDERPLFIKKNGVDNMVITYWPPSRVGAHISAPLLLTAGDYVEVIVRQTSGVSVDIIEDGDEDPAFWITKLGEP